LKIFAIFFRSAAGTKFAYLVALTASTPKEEMILENHKETMRSVRSERGQATLNRFPLVGLAMILACAVVGYGIVYLCFSLASS
jgi:hypothetical protein